MGRKSKLTEAQWEEIGRRLIEGESRRALGREFGVSETAVREHFASSEKEVREIKEVARRIVETECALEALPPLARKTAQNLAEKLRNISANLAGAAEYGSATALRLNALANSEVCKIDDAEPLQSLEALKGVALLTRLANSSADIALNLLSANKDAVKRLQDDEETQELDLTPERMTEGVRRFAFLLARAGSQPENT